MGLEPILYELMRLVSLPLDYSAILVVVLGIEPRIVESKSTVLPLHYTTAWCRWEDSNLRSYKRQIYSLLSLSILTTTTWLLRRDSNP